MEIAHYEEHYYYTITISAGKVQRVDLSYCAVQYILSYYPQKQISVAHDVAHILQTTYCKSQIVLATRRIKSHPTVHI